MMSMSHQKYCEFPIAAAGAAASATNTTQIIFRIASSRLNLFVPAMVVLSSGAEAPSSGAPPSYGAGLADLGRRLLLRDAVDIPAAIDDLV